jgi:hypothetical protein
MRPIPWHMVNPYRVQPAGYESFPNDNYGAFAIPYKGMMLRVLASSGESGRLAHGHAYAWDHVSVSLPNRCPNWLEMSYIKSLFWRDEETVMQLHVPVGDHRNLHETCLHLWKPLNERIPMPPADMVAVRGGIKENREYRDKKIG